jgi:hypothetical protein
MQNAGLPEAGDAVLTFPDEILADPDAYRDAASLSGDDRLAEAARRRDRAVEGFAAMLDGDDGERADRYQQFLKRAVALRRDLVPEWRDLWEKRPLAEARLTGDRLDALAMGSIDALLAALVASFSPACEQGYGMCGRLDTYLPEGWR